MTILWKLIGSCLVIIGSIFKLSNVLFLGYYLAGSGSRRSLPEYLDDTLISIFSGIELEDGDTCIINPDHFTCECQEVDRSGYNMLYETIGKFKAQRRDDVIYITDEYRFYPLCEDADIHFWDCGCSDREYAHLTKYLVKTSLIYKLLQPFQDSECNYFETVFKTKYIELDTTPEYLRLNISDEFWIDKGKPFNVYQELPVS